MRVTSGKATFCDESTKTFILKLFNGMKVY